MQKVLGLIVLFFLGKSMHNDCMLHACYFWSTVWLHPMPRFHAFNVNFAMHRAASKIQSFAYLVQVVLSLDCFLMRSSCISNLIPFKYSSYTVLPTLCMKLYSSSCCISCSPGGMPICELVNTYCFHGHYSIVTSYHDLLHV